MSRLVRPDSETRGLLTFKSTPVSAVTNTAETPGTPGAPNTAQPQETQLDNYTTRIVKYIPAEVISFYLAADKTFQSQSTTSDNAIVTIVISRYNWWFSLFVFVLSFVGLPLYYKLAAENDQPIGVNVVVSLIAFVIWSYSTRGSVWLVVFGNYNYDLYNSGLAGFLILSFTFIAGFVVPGK